LAIKIKGKPANAKPYRHIITKLRKRLERCIYIDPIGNLRIYRPSAWVAWLLWDFRFQELHSDGFYTCDFSTLESYANETRKHVKLAQMHEVPPDTWVEDSLDCLLAHELIFENARKGRQARFKPSRLIQKYWTEVEAIEDVVAPLSNSDIADILSVSHRLKRLEAVVSQLCRVTGLDFRI
jgi:hypothetical protein